MAAFGDPQYPQTVDRVKPDLRDGELQAMVRRGLVFQKLPATRDEVERITQLFPQSASKYLGSEATEEQVKKIGHHVSHLHFACHGVLNERFPLNSALALTIPESPRPGQENGLLQAWEIFESLRLDADLVTLSACETGLGKELGGEGLIGLSRAFQYAGARSVLASLWSVADESTAELMKRFYSYLKSGRSKDEALRAAQMEMIEDRGEESRFFDSSHPYHWAGFQLIGDWK